MSPEDRIERLASGMMGDLLGCPSADRIQDLIAGVLTTEDEQATQAHVTECAACSAAVEQMNGESSNESAAHPPLPSGVSERSERMIARVMGLPASGSEPPGPWVRSITRLAASIVLVGSLALIGWLGLGGRLFEDDPGSFRSVPALEPVAPVGDLAAEAVTFQWIEHPQAEKYRVLLFDTEMTKVWEGTTPASQPRLLLDPGVASVLKVGAWHTWQVVALGKIGEEIDRSPAGHFRMTGTAGD